MESDEKDEDLKDENLSRLKGKGSYRQKYKRAWELDVELRGCCGVSCKWRDALTAGVCLDWLSPFAGDPYSAYCRTCHSKLHAHKKGLLAHAKSSKHKKHVNSNEETVNGESSESVLASCAKKIKKSHFNDQWLEDAMFSQWLRKIPNNSTKALCVACRSVITAGRSELVKHSQAAKHKKAILDGIPEDLPDFDLEWLDPSYVPNSSSSIITLPSLTYTTSSIANITNTTQMIETTGMNLADIISQLGDHIPLHLAERWDNVGLLTQPTNPIKVHTIFLTIDLTEKVVEEAIKKRANLIIAYHPPIFRPLKSLLLKNWKEKIILQCVENRIAIYSPHTALDAIKGGINDWLLAAFGSCPSQPVQQSYADSNGSGHFSNCLDVLVSEGEDVTQALSGLENVILTVKSNEYGGYDVRVCCDDGTLPKVVEILSQHPVAQLCSRITKLQAPPLPGQGMGRLARLETPLPLYEVIHRIKQHLDLTHVRLAMAAKHNRDTKISTIAVCAGSGASVLKDTKADVLITGEMSHHEVLDAIHRGSSVILCEHTNTERGFLKNWCDQLKELFGQNVSIVISECDKDPLKVV